MADREVTGMRRRSDGRPVAVCHHGEDWSPRSAVDVIHDIETGAHAYHVNWQGARVRISVVHGARGPYLRAAPDGYRFSNLAQLPGCRPNDGPAPIVVTPRARRNIARVSAEERARLRDAILGLDQMPSDSGSTLWRLQDEIHQVSHVHNGPLFLPWHRELVNRFEALLRRVDPDVTLHYWDWRTDPRRLRGGTLNLFTPEFMGSDSGPAGDPFPNFTYTRDVAAGDPSMVDPDDWVIADDDYPSMRLDVERTHNFVHNYLGGSIGEGHSAFQDPFVFLLHANVDRLWASWQLRARGDHRNLLARVDPMQVYGDERDMERVDVNPSPNAGQFVDGIPVPMRPWNTLAMQTSIVRPPLYDQYVFPLGCSWEAMLLDAPLPDGDVIRARVTLEAVDPATIEIVLESDGVTWWKGLRVTESQGDSRMLHTENSRRSDRLYVDAGQLVGQHLVFHKAKVFGAHRIAYRLGDLGRIPPGARVTFTWLRD